MVKKEEKENRETEKNVCDMDSFDKYYSLVKTAVDLPGLHEVNTLHSTGRRSIPPSPKFAFLELYLRQNDKERLIKQHHRLKRQDKQLHRHFNAVNKNIAGLFKIGTAIVKGQEFNVDQREGFQGKTTVLEYPK